MNAAEKQNAEIRRLKAALRNIADLIHHEDYRDGFEPLLDDAIEIAKEALTK